MGFKLSTKWRLSFDPKRPEGIAVASYSGGSLKRGRSAQWQVIAHCLRAHLLPLQHLALGRGQLVYFRPKGHQLPLESLVGDVSPLIGGKLVLLVDAAKVVESTPCLYGIAPTLVLQSSCCNPSAPMLALQFWIAGTILDDFDRTHL